MTQNQLKYWELQEMIRSNKANEAVKEHADELNWRLAPYTAAEKYQAVLTGKGKQFLDTATGVLRILNPVTTALFS